MIPLNINDLDIYSIEKYGYLRNMLFRKIISKRKKQLKIYQKFLDKYYNLENTMLLKSAQQEAINKNDAKRYAENLKKGLEYITKKIDEEKGNEIRNVDIINLHRLIEPDSHKRHPNSYRTSEILLGKYAPPKPESLPNLIENLLYIVNSSKVNPVLKATYIHHEFVRIRPFLDGNGRVGRILGNWILIDNLYLPIYIEPKEKGKYNYLLERSFEEIEERSQKPGKTTFKFYKFILEKEKYNLNKMIKELG